jgi:hypothetical protein
MKDPLVYGNDRRGQIMRIKVGTIDRLALLCVCAVGALLAVVGGAIALGAGGAMLGVGISMMAFAVFYAILG